MEGSAQPLVLVTAPLETLSPEHVEPLLKAIDLCDHAIGRRPASTGKKILRWMGSLPRRLVFAVPVLDVDSPLLAPSRREAAGLSRLQSASSFLNLEILAKATFLGHLLSEVDVPPVRGWTSRRGWWTDLVTILKSPEFRQAPAAVSRQFQRKIRRAR